MHSYLADVYTKIVSPMSIFIKKIMMYFQLANEGELFACDLKFRLCHLQANDDRSGYIGDPGCKVEDAIQNLNTMKRQCTDKFKTALTEMITEANEAGDANARINISVALYLATYYDFNPSCKEYTMTYHSEPNFDKFLTVWKSENEEMIRQTQNPDSFLRKMRKSITQYHIACAEAEKGNTKKMRELLLCKKLFCIPWLLVGDSILIEYPDKYDSEEYK